MTRSSSKHNLAGRLPVPSAPRGRRRRRCLAGRKGNGRLLGDDTGAAAINVILLFPFVLFLTFSFLQYGLWLSATLVARSAVQYAVTLTAQGVPPDEARSIANQLILRSGVILHFEWEEGPAISSDGTAYAHLSGISLKIMPGPWHVRAVDTHQIYALPDRRTVP